MRDDAIMPEDLDGFPTSQPQESQEQNEGQSTADDSALEKLFGQDGGQATDDNQGGQGQTQSEDPATGQEQTGTQSQEGEPDFTPLLNQLSEKVKFNHGKMEFKSIDDAVPLIQKGANYDKMLERYNQAQEQLEQLQKDPARGFLESRAQAAGMTVDQYIQEVRKAEEQDRVNEMVEKGISEEMAREMVENRKFREAYQQQQEWQQREAAEKAKIDAETKDFLDFFMQENGRPYNPQTDELPQEVWELNAKGTPLRSAYMEHQAQSHKAELARIRAELEQAKARQAQNQQNQQRAVIGSVSGHGGSNPAPEDPFLKGFDSF